MKERVVKIGVMLFLVAVLVCTGVIYASPQQSRAATGVKYNVEIQSDSPGVVLWAPAKGELYSPITMSWQGTTFQMLVDKKAKAEVLVVGKKKIKTSYYPVTILAKSFKAPNAPFKNGDYAFELRTTMLKDAVGKLYASDTDVDVSAVQAKSKATVKIGDGTNDPKGSMIVNMGLIVAWVATDYGVTAMKEEKVITTLTTGQSSILVKGTKSLLEGKKLPDDDPTGTLPKPLVGAPVDLSGGTGTLVATACFLNQNLMQAGATDILKGFVWTMKITPTSK